MISNARCHPCIGRRRDKVFLNAQQGLAVGDALGGLEAGEAYDYVVENGDTTDGPHRFHAAPSPDADEVFWAWLSDNQEGWERFEVHLSHIAAQQPDLLVVPEPQIRETTATVPGLDGRKMSKSYDNAIEIFEETEKKLRKKIMKIVTDSTPVEDPKDPADSYITQLYQLFASADEVKAMEDSFRAGGQGYGHYKQQLFEAIRDFFAPMRERREELVQDTDYVDGVLEEGAKRAGEKAREVMDRVRSAVGM